MMRLPSNQGISTTVPPKPPSIPQSSHCAEPAALPERSDRQTILLSQALVKSGFWDETAQKTDLARYLPRCVAPPWSRGGRCFQDRLGYDLWSIALFDRLPQDRVHTGARGAVNIKQPIGPGEIFFKRRARIGGLDQHHVNSERAQLVIERFGIAFDRMFGRRIESGIGSRN